MIEPVEVRVRDEMDLSNAFVVVGVPSLGLAGTIASQYLTSQLETEHVGGFFSRGLHPVARIAEGRPRLPVAMHALETPCGVEGQADRLVVVESQLWLDRDSQYGIADALAEFALANDARAVALLDGLVVQGEESSTMRGAGATQRAAQWVDDLGLEILDGGVLSGLSGAVLFEAEDRGLDAMCLLAESSPYHPDARAAARLVDVLDGLVPKVEIPTDELLREAEQIEEAVRAEQARVRAAIDESPGFDDTDVMYQ